MKVALNIKTIRANIANVLAIIFFLWIAAVVFSPFLDFLPHRHDRMFASTCASNLKQIGLALSQYEQDNDGKIPNVAQTGSATKSWRTAILPYLSNRGAYQCPSRQTFDSLDGLPISYAANDSGAYQRPAGYQGQGAFSPDGAKPLTAAEFTEPSQLIAVCEITGTASYDIDVDDSLRFVNGSERLWTRHEGASNYLLADGHVKRLKPDETIATRGRARNLWYRDNAAQLSMAGMTVVEKADR